MFERLTLRLKSSETRVVAPRQVITRLIGAPVEQTDDSRQWAHDRIALLGSAPSPDEDERATIALRLIRFSGWLRDFVESRRKAAGN
jgi:cytochrome P450